MNEAFEKILERLRNSVDKECVSSVPKVRLCDAVQIVQEVAEEYKGGWIACSDRLPEYGEVVMCSCTNSGITISCITHKGVKPSKSVRFGQHSVIAWQPLPEPFKERD